MSVVCGKCNYLRKEVEYVPEWQCPSCGVAYNKVNNQQANQVHAQTNVSHLDNHPSNTESLAVISGQKYMVYGVLLSFISIFFKPLLNIVVFEVSFGVSLILTILGMLKIYSQIEEKTILKILYIVLLFIPLLNLFALFRVNSLAKKYLTEQGYEVGALGLKDALLTAPRFYGILFLSVILASSLKVKQVTDPNFLAKTLNDQLKTPIAINNDIRFDGLSASGKTLLYKYTLVNFEQDRPSYELQQVLTPEIIKKHLCDIYQLHPNLTGHKSDIILMGNYYNISHQLILQEQKLADDC